MPYWKPEPRPRRERQPGSTLPRPSKPMARGGPIERRAVIKPNRERAAKRYAETFGDYADTIRGLPCCVCRPDLYREGRPLPRPVRVRLSDPSHAVKRSQQGKRWHLVPHGGDFDCGHHRWFEGLGKRRHEIHEAVTGIHPLRLAARLWAAYGDARDEAA